ncbi:Vanillate O-demethylase oxygenase subunit [hydrothermal vent metagenome]|uniref:Vanillate O-demethylase oxygenase subunit n=1 Tax=hydrothermal vent metagenome TaxID=652676 RepID=A0A3B0R6R5_9ZZZZ
MTFVKNAWYVAGWASEFGDELRALTILEQNIVMFRASTGKVVALEDRCPHRLLPLSKGQRIGDDIQCGYHGMTFNCEGKCVRVPGQDNLPASAYVETFPVHEKYDIVWIWMGDSTKADSNEIFDLPQFTDPVWDAHQGEALHLKSNYLNVAENLVDPAHVSFVHPTTLGNAASQDVPVNTETDGDVIVAWRWIRDAEPIGFFKAFGGFTGNVDRWHYYYLHLPSIAVIDFGSAAVKDNLAEDERDKGVRLFALHFLTPITKDYTIDRWMHLRNTAINDETVSRNLDELFKTAFAEDKEILEAIQIAENQPQSRPPIRIAIDKGPLVYRKRINHLIEQEHGQNQAD